VDATARSPPRDGGGGRTRPGSAEEIRLEGVSKVYPDGTVGVAELDLTFAAGELTVLVGPSGCGKTTTMKMINRIIEPTTGRILLGGEDVTRVDPTSCAAGSATSSRTSASSPTRPCAPTSAPSPGCSAGTSGASGPGRRAAGHRRPRPGRYGDRYPAQLSGGQRQRAGVARALAADPPCCSWTSRSPPSTRSCASGCSRSSCGCRRGAQDDRLRHPRHRGGGAARRPDRGDEPGRARRAVRHAGRAAGQAGQPVRGRLRGRRPRAQAAGGDRHRHRRPRAPAGGARRRRLADARAALHRAGARWAVVLDDAGTCTAGCPPSGPRGGTVGSAARRMEAWVPVDASLKTAFATMLQTGGRLGRRCSTATASSASSPRSRCTPRCAARSRAGARDRAGARVTRPPRRVHGASLTPARPGADPRRWSSAARGRPTPATARRGHQRRGERRRRSTR
jgi:osmoprotectant transport system ATP-binding protein